VEQGLSQGSVMAITQDKQGFLWFGTEDGLNRYDGYTFRTYRRVEGDSSSLPDNFITSLTTGADGRIWVGSIRGMAVYDPGQDSFRPVAAHTLGRAYISQIVFLDSLRLFIGTRNNFFALYDIPNKRLRKTDRLDTLLTFTRGGNLDAVTATMINPRTMMILYNPGLIFYDMLSSKITRVIPAKFKKKTIYLWSKHLVPLPGGGWLIGTSDNGLYTFHPEEDRFKRLPAYMREKTQGISVIDMLREKEGDIYWIATKDKGLLRWDIRKKQITRFRYRANDPGSISGNFIESLYQDREGTFWAGCNANGLNYTNVVLNKFNHYTRQNGLSDNMIYALYCAPNSKQTRIWIGTDKGGLNLYDPATDRIRSFTTQAGKPLPAPSVRVVYRDRARRYWIGTFNNGMFRFDPDNETFHALQPFRDYSIRTIGEDSLGAGRYLWVGTADAGLFRYDTQTGAIQNFKSQKQADGFKGRDIRAWLTDRNGVCWIGTFSNGLNRLDVTDTTFTRYINQKGNPQSLSHNIVLSLCEQWQNGKQYIWVGTADGLNRFDVQSQTFRRIGQAEGLINGVVYSIQKDTNGMLWLTTNKGLHRFNPADTTFINYSVEDGLQNMEFNVSAACMAPNGEMYIGGVNGFNRFHPLRLPVNRVPPPVVITGFQLFNKPAVWRAPLTLRYDQNVFSFEYAALSFPAPQKNRYAFKMEGFDRDWIDAGTRRFTTYTNLDPGVYTFRVKASNHDGLWNEEGVRLPLIITPPPWRSPWAYLLYVLLLFFLYRSGKWAVANRKSILALRKRRLSHYKILERIGEGGLATVFRAVDTNTDKIVALKLLKKELSNDPENRRRFHNEGRILSGLDHPHLVRTYEMGQVGDEMFIAMEYLPGPTLARYHKDNAPLPEGEVIRLARQILDGLQIIHNNRIIHRDLKTANIMFDADNKLRIMDFGLAKSHLSSMMTASGTLMGTLGFVAPEQISSAQVDHRVDIFSFGVILYEMLTGKLPFYGENEMALIHTIFSARPVPPVMTRPDLHPDWDAIVARCLAKQPEERYRQCAEIRNDLDTIYRERNHAPAR